LLTKLTTLNSNFVKLNNKFKITDNSYPTSAWDNNTELGLSIYKYETEDITAYNIPYIAVIVFVYRWTSTRGIAIAMSWSVYNKGIWVNRLHDNWRGWTQIHS
jgi:hypothetical protein